MKFALFALVSAASGMSVKVKQDCKYQDLNNNDHCVLKDGYSLEGPDACEPIPETAVFSAGCGTWSLV